MKTKHETVLQKHRRPSILPVRHFMSCTETTPLFRSSKTADHLHLKEYVEGNNHRLEDISLPPSITYLAIHAGTNNVGTSQPHNHASGVLAIGAMAKALNPSIRKILVTGLLHCDKDGKSYGSDAA